MRVHFGPRQTFAFCEWEKRTVELPWAVNMRTNKKDLSKLSVRHRIVDVLKLPKSRRRQWRVIGDRFGGGAIWPLTSIDVRVSSFFTSWTEANLGVHVFKTTTDRIIRNRNFKGLRNFNEIESHRTIFA